VNWNKWGLWVLNLNTLLKFKSSPLKNDSWRPILSFSGLNFQGGDVKLPGSKWRDNENEAREVLCPQDLILLFSMVGVIPLVKSSHFAYKKKLQEILPKNGPYLLESITSPNFSTCYDHNYEPPQLVRGFFFWNPPTGLVVFKGVSRVHWNRACPFFEMV